MHFNPYFLSHKKFVFIYANLFNGLQNRMTLFQTYLETCDVNLISILNTVLD